MHNGGVVSPRLRLSMRRRCNARAFDGQMYCVALSYFLIGFGDRSALGEQDHGCTPNGAICPDQQDRRRTRGPKLWLFPRSLSSSRHIQPSAAAVSAGLLLHKLARASSWYGLLHEMAIAFALSLENASEYSMVTFELLHGYVSAPRRSRDTRQDQVRTFKAIPIDQQLQLESPTNSANRTAIVVREHRFKRGGVDALEVLPESALAI